MIKSPGSHKNENTSNSGDDFPFLAHIQSQKIFSDQNFCQQKFRKDTQTPKTTNGGKYERKNFLNP
jgi:hypothetical protein